MPPPASQTGAPLRTAAIVTLLVVVLFFVHPARPDLLRFEHVGLTARPAVLDALSLRLASLEERTFSRS